MCCPALHCPALHCLHRCTPNRAPNLLPVPPNPSCADVCDSRGLPLIDSLGLPLIDSLPVEPSPIVDWSLEGLESFKAHNAHVSAVHELVDALQVRAGWCQ